MMTRRNESGYSLVEVSMTVAILGVLIAIAVPSFRDTLPRTRMRSATRILSTDINLTRLQAISRNKEYKLFLDKARDTYYMYEGNLTENSTAWTFKRQQQMEKTVDLNNVQNIKNDSLIFRPDGTIVETISADREIYIRLEGSRPNLASRLNIDSATGRVIVERWNGSSFVDERHLKS